MIIIGEKINSSRLEVKTAFSNKDETVLRQMACDQVAAGAHYLDVNAGTLLKKENELLPWAVQIIQETTGKPCCIDTPNAVALEEALRVHQGQAFVNSISLESERYQTFIPLVRAYGSKVIALCISDSGMPATKEDRFRIASLLIERLTRDGIPLQDIYVDPLVQPLSTNHLFGPEFLDAISMIMNGFPGVHTVCGLSNISYGLPKRKQINRVFLTLAFGKGLDAAIIDPTDVKLKADLVTTMVLLGQDPKCKGYLTSYRQGLFEDYGVKH